MSADDLSKRASAMQAALRLVGMTSAADVMAELMAAAKLEGEPDLNTWRVFIRERFAAVATLKEGDFVGRCPVSRYPFCLSCDYNGLVHTGTGHTAYEAAGALLLDLAETYGRNVQVCAPGIAPQSASYAVAGRL